MTITLSFSSPQVLVWIVVGFFLLVWLDIALVRDCWRSSRSESWKVFLTALIVSVPYAGGIVYLAIKLFDRDEAALAIEEAELKRRLNDGS